MLIVPWFAEGTCRLMASRRYATAAFGSCTATEDRSARRGSWPRGTRAPHRLNPIARSVLRVVKVEGLPLYVDRSDLLDGRPVLDITPYVPCTDAFPAYGRGGSTMAAKYQTMR